MRSETRVDLVLIQLGTGGVAAVGASLAGSEHLGLSYLAAAAEAGGFRAQVIDLEESMPLLAVIISTIVALDPIVIGMSPTSKTAPQAALLSDKLRQELPNSLIVWGGHLATGLGAETFSASTSIDCVVVREGETVIPALIEFGRRKALPRLPTLLINPSSLFNGAHGANSTNPDWRLLRPVRYKSSQHYARHGARILTSVGCKFDCSFCTTPTLFGRVPRNRTPAHVVEEVASLAENFGARRFWINDDLFCDGSEASQRRVIEIATRMHDAVPDAKFRAMLRSDLISRRPDFIRTLKANGLEAVFVGLESGNVTDIAVYRKRVTVAQNIATVEVLRGLGVFLQIGFIMFSPESTIASLVENTAFLKKIGQLYRFMPLSRTVQIFPGTALWNSNIDTEAERSTAYSKIPIFRDRAVNVLSQAFEHLEEEFAALDRLTYQRVFSNLLSPSELRERSNHLFALVRRACILAERGSTVQDIIDIGRETKSQLANL